jgi:hypothetical protein
MQLRMSDSNVQQRSGVLKRGKNKCYSSSEIAAASGGVVVKYEGERVC